MINLTSQMLYCLQVCYFNRLIFCEVLKYRENDYLLFDRLCGW